MAWNLINNNSIQTASGTTTLTLPLTAVSSGDLLVGGFNYFNQGNTLSAVGVADNAGNTYNFQEIQNSPNQSNAVFFWRGNIIGAPTSITLTVNGNLNAAFFSWGIADEFSGELLVSDPHDQETGQAQLTPSNGANTITSGNVTTTANSELIYGLCACLNDNITGAGITIGTGFILGQSPTPSSFSLISEYLIQASAGVTAATFGTTNGSSIGVSTFVVAVKPAATGGAIGSTLILMGT